MRITSYWRQWTQMSFLEMGVISRAVGIWAQAVSSRVHDGMCLWDGTTSQDQLDWSWAGLCEALLDTRVFPCVPFLIWRKKAFSFLDLPRVPKGIFKQLLTGEGRGGRRRHCCSKGPGAGPSSGDGLAVCACLGVLQQELGPPQPRQRRSLQVEHKQVDPHWLERLMTEMAGTRPCYLTTSQSEGSSARCSPCPRFYLLKLVYYHVRNESPVYVWCRIQDAWGWCTGMIQRDDMGWEVGGGVQDWELMYTRGGFMSMYGKTNTVL